MFELPPSEESVDRLRRSGWCCGESAFHLEAGGVVWVVDGRNGENALRVEGASAREAWHRAVEAAAAVGMLEDRSRGGAGGRSIRS